MGCNPTVNYGKFFSKLHQPPGVNGRLDFGSSAAGGAGFLERLFNRFVGLARALLDPANQFSSLPSMYWRSLSVSLAHFSFSLPLVVFQSPLISSVVMSVAFVLLFVYIRRQQDGKTFPRAASFRRLGREDESGHGV